MSDEDRVCAAGFFGGLVCAALAVLALTGWDEPAGTARALWVFGCGFAAMVVGGAAAMVAVSAGPAAWARVRSALR